jgi:hypothetical protein
VNTGFAQEEVETLQINFTRFSLVFPEKRQFFLDDRRPFQFGAPGESDPVFTRRIGLSDRGDPVPILGGARLSGHPGPGGASASWTFRPKAAGPFPARTSRAARVGRDLFQRSQMGAVFTNRQGGNRYPRRSSWPAASLCSGEVLRSGP